MVRSDGLQRSFSKKLGRVRGFGVMKGKATDKNMKDRAKTTPGVTEC